MTEKKTKKKATKKKAKKKVTKKKATRAGPKEKLTKDLKSWILYLCKEGKTNEEIASIVNINASTLYAWQKKYPELKESIKEAKKSTDDLVEEALLDCALGYDYEEEKLLTVSDGGKMGSHVERHSITMHRHKDPRAIMFWLKNRRPDSWRDLKAVEAEVSGKDGGPISVEHAFGQILEEIDGETSDLSENEE